MAPGKGHPSRDSTSRCDGADARPRTPRYDPRPAYETIMRHAPLRVAVYDTDLVIRDASEACARVVGATRGLLRGRHLRDHLTDEQVADCRRVLGDGDPADADTDAATASPKRIRALPVRDAHGTVKGGVAILAGDGDPREADGPLCVPNHLDPVTTLPNRRMIDHFLERALSGAKAGKRRLAVAWINVDRFKDVNRALGHEAGDALLRSVGARLQDAVRVNDIVGHAGGNDFLLVLPRVTSRRHLERLIDRVHGVFNEPFVVGSESLLLTASCGLALHPKGAGDDPRDLADCAYTAMRAAKDLGGGTCRLYEADELEAPHRVHLLREIHDGIAHRQFTLHYQPQVALRTMAVQAVEALVRWQHPKRGLLLPAEFVVFAEETSMIVPLGRHVLELACREHSDWLRAMPQPPRLAVNVSAREFQRTDVCAQVRAAAGASGIPVSRLEIEITETAVLADPAHAAQVTACLHEAGATVALDDFGTGYSSLTHLRDLPVDRIKVDRSFVTRCLEDRSASAIMVGIIQIAHDLAIQVVAEGVETQAQLDFVRAVGCDAAQGHFLARPLPSAECLEYVLRTT